MFLQRKELFSISWEAAAWFAIIGIMSLSMGRLFNYQGIQRIGAARAATITSASPLFASLTAVIFLKEVPNLLVVMGTILVVGGLYIIMRSK